MSSWIYHNIYPPKSQSTIPKMSLNEKNFFTLELIKIRWIIEANKLKYLIIVIAYSFFFYYDLLQIVKTYKEEEE